MPGEGAAGPRVRDVDIDHELVGAETGQQEVDWPRRYVGRTGSLAEYERVEAGPRDLGAFARELPWVARNVLIKVLVLAGRRRWAERLGLDPAAPWPY